MRKAGLLYGIVLGGMLLIFNACKTTPDKADKRDTPQEGSIRISVDESFKPVIEEQLHVHHSSFPNTNIHVTYTSEATCFRDLQSDSTRMIIVARGLNKQESSFYKDKLSYTPQYAVLAYDAVAVIINKDAKDSLFTMERLKAILSGKEKITAVMDGQNATSTVRFLKDSVLRGGNFGSNVVAEQNSLGVINQVSQRTDVIGFVGLSWVGDSYDPAQQEYMKKIRLGLVECVNCTEKGFFAKPSQATITYMQYPLARPLYYVLKENTAGLGTGFMNFMSLERGQLIFRSAFLAPAIMALDKRTSSIKDSD